MQEGVEIGVVAVSKEVVGEVAMPCVEDQDCLLEDLLVLAPDHLHALLLRQGQNCRYVICSWSGS